jgi:competence ComEA-like helix-hairpin-helix protein
MRHSRQAKPIAQYGLLIVQSSCLFTPHSAFCNPQLPLPLIFVCTLLITSTSCVKLPRQHQLDGGQTAPLSSQTSATNAPLINLNIASSEELERLPGIGKGLAARIIAYRNQYGRFRRPEHLMMVRGISDRRFRTLRALITAE